MIMLLLVAVSVHGTTYQATEAAIENTETLASEDDTSMVYEKKASIFACDKAEVYCNVDVAIGGDEMVKKGCRENPCTLPREHMLVLGSTQDCTSRSGAFWLQVKERTHSQKWQKWNIRFHLMS